MSYVRLLMIGVAGFAAAGVASAQSAPANSGQQGSTPADLVVAASVSNDGEVEADTGDASTTAEGQPSTAPAKPRRAARVTTCRCGDSGQ